MHNTRFTVR